MQTLDPAEQWYEQLRLDELIMIEQNYQGELPQGPAWYYHIRLADDADRCFRHIMELMRLILTAPHYAWPSESQWRVMLPAWFLSKTVVRSQAEVEYIMQHVPRQHWSQLAWGLDSWLDVLHDREWRWWSYHRMGHEMVIFFELTSWPALLATFDFVLQAADATILQQHRWPLEDEL